MSSQCDQLFKSRTAGTDQVILHLTYNSGHYSSVRPTNQQHKQEQESVRVAIQLQQEQKQEQESVRVAMQLQQEDELAAIAMSHAM